MDESESKNNHCKYKHYILYFVTHIIIGFFACYLSIKCNGGNVNVLSMLVALFFPYIYILYVLIAKNGCGIFDTCVVEPIRALRS